MASSLARTSSSADLSCRFSSSAAWSCCALRSLRCAVAAAVGALQAVGLGVEYQPLLDVLQMNQREDVLLGQQRIAGREQLGQQRAAPGAASLAGCVGVASASASMRRFVVVGDASAAAATLRNTSACTTASPSMRLRSVCR